MSKVLGIVAEYNPFHNGHLYHIEKSKELTNADYAVAIIGGNFSQRGSTSIINKWAKTEMALKNGIDLVIELPLLYSISSGENFADGAIKILNSLGIIDYLSFGSETHEIGFLDNIASILYNEPIEYKNLLLSELNSGLSFPVARENAILKYMKNYVFNNNIDSIKNIDTNTILDTYSNILNSPNNILGIEYLKSLKKHNSNIKPICIQRVGAGHNFVSASLIRDFTKSNEIEKVKKLLPESSFSILEDNFKLGNIVPDLKSFEKIIFYNLRKMTTDEIANLPDVNEGLEYLIKKAYNSCNTISEFIDIVKSKRYTQTRIQRILLYALLGITKQNMKLSKNIEVPYIRVLGFNDNGQNLLSEITNKNPNLPIITSVKKFMDDNDNINLKNMLEKDIFASNVYTLACKSNSTSNLDYTHKIIREHK